MNARPLTQLADLEAALAREGLEAATHAELLERTRRFLGRYAELERDLLGGIQIALPRHLLETEFASERPEELVEMLAHRERERLDLAGIGERDVAMLLDHEGLKVYRPPFPPGTALQGFFVFDESVGPAFVVDGRLSRGATNTVLAQLYGHYLLDHDPYEIRLVRVGTTAASARSLRGRHFAVAFLVGREELASYLRALKWTPGDPVTPHLLEHLSVYFEVDAATIATRLLSLGLLGADEPALEELTSDPPESLEETPVPDRFVRLALEAHALGGVTDPELARYLETDVRSARRLAAQFQGPELDSPNPAG